MGWVQEVKTVSTFPPATTFASWRPGVETARIMADPLVSPKGWNSAVAMVVYFMNRQGKRLREDHRIELTKAKRLLQLWRDHGRLQSDFLGAAENILRTESA